MAYLTLLMLGVLDAAGYSVIAPVVPEIADTTSSSPATVGTLIATFPVGMVIGFAVWGSAVNRYGPRRVISLALGFIATGCLGFVLGTGLTAYFAARFVMGIGSGGLWIGITFDTLRRWPGQEYLCMSRIFAAYSVGGLVGPALGAIEGIRGPFLGYAVLVVAALVPVWFMRAPAARASFASDRSVLRLPGFWVASAAILFTVLGLGIVEGVLPLHLAGGLDQVEIGLVYACVSLLVAGTAAAAARFKPRLDVVVAAGLITSGLMLAGTTTSVALWLLALVATGAGIGFGNTGSIGVLLESVRPERIVTAMILWSQIGIAGYLLGPVLAGAVAQAVGFSALGLVPLASAIALLLAMHRLPQTPNVPPSTAA